jgi:hypothetical protein
MKNIELYQMELLVAGEVDGTTCFGVGVATVILAGSGPIGWLGIYFLGSTIKECWNS